MTSLIRIDVTMKILILVAIGQIGRLLSALQTHTSLTTHYNSYKFSTHPYFLYDHHFLRLFLPTDKYFEVQ